jgi:phenylalanyl-tRNA synthetase alpha chain
MLYKLAAKCREPEGDGGATSSPGSVKFLREKDDGFKPAKLFSIDRVFRNETMDATHLAEFHQVEGVVADRDLTLADLIGEFTSIVTLVSLTHIVNLVGFMRVFFRKMGIEKVRFKPAYNPYTEVGKC